MNTFMHIIKEEEEKIVLSVENINKTKNNYS
jgi:hypothetical protein